MSNSNIEIKIGAFEFSAAGDQEWLDHKIQEAVIICEKLSKSNNFVTPTVSSANENTKISQTTDISTNKMNLSTGTIAARLDVKSGPQLARAACCTLHFVKGLESYGRKEILEEMKSAKSYYKTAMSKNLSSILNGLVKDGTLNECGNDVYALHNNEIVSLYSKLEAA